ncbi:Alpha/Beta hydrolase protein [Coniochaeta sp. 2T2.1]|nr:Alpha/Beta hydrolase protein [Coniochaeta sp. 2T2.1]
MCDFSSYGGPSEDWLAVAATLPPPPVMELLELRRVTNEGREAVAAEAMKHLASQVLTRDHLIRTRDGGTVEARSYRPADVPETEQLPVYIHLHGGGFLFGTLAAEDATCSRIAIKSRVVVLNVNYRHTPEFTYPTAWHDVQDAFEWTHSHIRDIGGDHNKVVVGGISAGAWLTASLALEQHLGRVATNRPAIAGQILIIPCLASMDCYGPQLAQMKDVSVSSYTENEHAPVLPMKTMRLFTDLLKIQNPEVDDTKLNPGNASAEQVKGLPPTVFGIAGLDPLRDEGLLYAKKLTEAGVPTDINLFKGVPHGFRRYGDKLSESARWDKVMEDGIQWALSGPSPTFKFDVKT